MLQRSGAIVAGKYRLEKPLARGGVGTVWTAHHVQLGHPVAVKFLDQRVAASAQVRTRFEREARASAHLRTPHIVQVFDYGIQSDTPYLVMELLHGETLSSRLRRDRRLSIADAYRMVVQIGKGLKRAHDEGFVHRDLKPANLYLARHEGDDEEVVKILDFGIAKETGGEVVGESTKTGELVGSPHYMSPEQIRGEREVDARSDLWALGVILYKMITGYLPFPGEVLTAVITKIVVDPLPSARDYLPDAPASLDAFFAKALARDRAGRFQSVRDLVQAFGEVAAESAGVANAQPTSGLGAARASLASIPDGGSLPGGAAPSSIPGSVPGVGIPRAALLGSMPGDSIPGSIPEGSYPGGSMPGSITPAPPTLTSADPSLPPAPIAASGKGRWIALAITAVVALGVGATFSVLRTNGAAAGDPPPEPPRAAASVPTPATAPATSMTAAPPTTASPAPSASTSASTSAAEPAVTATASAGKSRPPPAGAKPRGAATKKPVDTID